MLPKIAPVVYVIIGAASPNHLHVSSSKNYNMLSNATGCPKDLLWGVFQHAKSKFAIRFALCPLQQYKPLTPAHKGTRQQAASYWSNPGSSMLQGLCFSSNQPNGIRISSILAPWPVSMTIIVCISSQTAWNEASLMMLVAAFCIGLSFKHHVGCVIKLERSLSKLFF